jgi:short-subunit dehydrogenase
MNIWITGASSGIGEALAIQYAQNGHTVFASARNNDKLQQLSNAAASFSGSIEACPLDVTDVDSINQALTQILANGKPIDLAILNAGFYEPIEFEQLTLDHFEKTFDVNLMGVVRCMLPVLEHFRQQQAGHLAIVSSVSGYRGLPKAAAYGSSKAALINMAESLKPECNANGIKITLVNPGFVKSKLTDQNEFTMPFILETDDAATRIIKGLESNSFELSFPKRFTYGLKMLRILPYRLYFLATKGLIK